MQFKRTCQRILGQDQMIEQSLEHRVRTQTNQNCRATPPKWDNDTISRRKSLLEFPQIENESAFHCPVISLFQIHRNNLSKSKTRLSSNIDILLQFQRILTLMLISYAVNTIYWVIRVRYTSKIRSTKPTQLNNSPRF